MLQTYMSRANGPEHLGNQSEDCLLKLSMCQKLYGTSRVLTLDVDGPHLVCWAASKGTGRTNGGATMRKIAAAACLVSIWSASSVFAMDLVTKAPQQEEISQNSSSLQSFSGTGQQSYVFGDWGGLRSWLSNQGIDLGLSYLSEPACNLAGDLWARAKKSVPSQLCHGRNLRRGLF